VTKSELIERMAAKSAYLTHPDTLLAVNTLLEEMAKTLGKNERIEIRESKLRVANGLFPFRRVILFTKIIQFMLIATQVGQYLNFQLQPLHQLEKNAIRNVQK